MQKRGTMLKSIQNMETEGKNERSFTIINNASVDYLENVTSSCGINLGSHLQNPKDIITAMQAQEVANAAKPKQNLTSQKVHNRMGKKRYKGTSEMLMRTLILLIMKLGVLQFSN